MEKFDKLYKKWSELADSKSEDSEKSISLARELVNINPNSVDAWDALASSISGYFFYPPKDHLKPDEKRKISQNPLFDDMHKAYEKALSIKSDDSSFPWNRAISYEQIDQFEEAAKQYVIVAEIEKKCPYDEDEYLDGAISALYCAARCLYQIGLYEEAYNHLKQALIDIIPYPEYDGWELMSKILYKMGRSKESIKANNVSQKLKEFANIYDEFEKFIMMSKIR